MSHPRRSRRPSAFSLNLVAGFTGLTIAALSFLSLAPISATAAGGSASASDGSDWGPAGAIGSDSPKTVRWDNQGNTTVDTVYRDQRQVLPHTNAKTYFDVSSGVRSAYAKALGSNNGLGGLTVDVSQTGNLVNQSVQVSVSGFPGGNSETTGSFIQVFQCWGALGADGDPDPDATSPDPATCQVGAGGGDTGFSSDGRVSRYVRGDALALGGDWEDYVASSSGGAPFLALDGETVDDRENPYFSNATTNELSQTFLPPSGRVNRQFEVQTGSEAAGLGCGSRADAPSTPSCWLVVVPRLPLGQLSDRDWGPVSPSIWAQRIQVKLDFRDVAGACPSGQSQLLIGGSELLSTAAASWTPGVCDNRNIALGYSQYGDQVARNQLVTGTADAIVSTSPLPAAVTASYTPLALAAPVIAAQIDYVPVCDVGGRLGEVTTDGGARDCGYDDLDDLRREQAKAGSPLTDLRLNARLVAKLLTQSYGCSAGCSGFLNHGAWAERAGMARSLFEDPEFRDLNPQLRHMTSPRGGTISDLIVEGMRSDAASAVWSWMLADVGARSFLEGCPDPNDFVINPFYSTRSYDSCEFRSAAYEARAEKSRAEIDTPSGFVDAPARYPSEGSPYPLVTWTQYEDSNGVPYTMVDQHPRVDSMAIGGRTTFKAIVPWNSEWCPTFTDTSCTPEPGKYRDPKKPQVLGERRAITITDSATAARYQLPTASLCDETGANCVGASTKSLQVAADRFQKTDVSGVVAASTKPAYSKGAYPLALPVYGIVSPSVSQSDAKAFASAFGYIVSSGQKPGFDSGELPPGYAPLTASLKKQAAKAISALKSGTFTGNETPDDADEPETDDAPDLPPVVPPTAPDSSEVPPADPAPPATPTPTPAPVVATFTTPAEPSVPQLALPIGLAIALLSGLLAPFLRKRSRIRVQR